MHSATIPDLERTKRLPTSGESKREGKKKQVKKKGMG
jgi:hypothetical protein